jgi:peptidoglycan/LPS O-acetylase OafA/YrhL
VISGFVINRILLREDIDTGRFAVLAFYERRFWKIAPPLLLFVMLPTALLMRRVDLEAGDVASQVGSYFNWVYMSGDAHVLPGSGVLWSLSVEEQFYFGWSLIWALALLARRSTRSYLTPLKLVTTGVLSGILLVNIDRLIINYVVVSHERTYYGTDTRLDGLLIGILVSIILHHAQAGLEWSVKVVVFCSRGYSAVAAVAIYVGTLVIRDEYFRETGRYFLQAVAAAIVLIYGATPPRSKATRLLLGRICLARPVQIIGLASYSIYLCHFSLMKALSVVAAGTAFDSLPMRILIAIVVGVIGWRVVEIPIAHKVRRSHSRSSSKTYGLRAKGTVGLPSALR